MYIFNKEVKEIDGTTVHFVDGTTKEYTEKQLTYIVTEDTKDHTEYRELIISNVLPEVKALFTFEEKDEDMINLGVKMFSLLEEHDITSKELQSILTRLQQSVVDEYNVFIKEKVGKEMDKFQSDMNIIKEAQSIVLESFDRALFVSIGKLLGTYEEGKTDESCMENIRFSHLSKVLKQL